MLPSALSDPCKAKVASQKKHRAHVVLVEAGPPSPHPGNAVLYNPSIGAINVAPILKKCIPNLTPRNLGVLQSLSSHGQKLVPGKWGSSLVPKLPTHTHASISLTGHSSPS